MLIILLAHVPGNAWALWIPARFGFSDATEIFVFCSGMASALAFGAVFTARGWWLGTARVAFRIWQVYWAHVGVFMAAVALLLAIDLGGWGIEGRNYLREPFVLPFFEDPKTHLLGLMTLRYVPGLFDILPMYLVILAMIPAVMLVHRLGGGSAVLAVVLGLWALAFLGRLPVTGAAWGWTEAPGPLARLLLLPSLPDGSETWFFDPFAWQVVFFLGFALGMGWLAPPAVTRGRIVAAVAVIVLSVPFAWFRLHQGHYLPPGSPTAAWLTEARAMLLPFHDKTAFGVLRLMHFVALAYLAWIAAGAHGWRLAEPLRLPVPSRRRVWGAAAAVLAVLTLPYAQADAVHRLWPGLSDLIPAAPDHRLGPLSIVHFAAVVMLLWCWLPAAAFRWIGEVAWPLVVRLVCKVGTQSLAVFMLSVPLSILCGLVLDWTGRDRVTVAAVNLSGFAIMIGTAYVCAWFKSHPWREPAPSVRPGVVRAATPAE
jgi:hypothetical protein